MKPEELPVICDVGVAERVNTVSNKSCNESSNTNNNLYTSFYDTIYIGSISIDSPKDRSAIIDCIRLFNYNKTISDDILYKEDNENKTDIYSRGNEPLLVTMNVPKSCLNSVSIIDQSTGNEIAKFKISRIMFCARGEEGSPDQSFFAFTCSHGKADTPLDAIFKCHIFQCQSDSFNTTGDILLAFAKAFRRPEEQRSPYTYPPVLQRQSLNNLKEELVDENGNVTEEVYTRVIGVSLEIKEKLNHGNFSVCPVDSSTQMFKLRQNLEKYFKISVHSFTPNYPVSPNHPIPPSTNSNYSSNFNSQKSLNDAYDSDQSADSPLNGASKIRRRCSDILRKGLKVERCFGIHITPGTDFNQNKLHLLDIINMNHLDNNELIYNINVSWDPKDYNMQEFIVYSANKEIAYLVFNLGLDLIFAGVQEPIRLLLNVRARLYPEGEKFWHYLSKQKALRETYYIDLRRVISTDEIHVSTVKSHTQISKNMPNGSNQPPGYDLNPLSFGNLNNFLQVNGTSFLSALPTSLLKPSLLVPKLLNRVNSVSTSPHTPTTTTPDEDYFEFIDDLNHNNSDNDEPLLSGTGQVRKDCETSELEIWAEILTEWRNNIDRRPKKITALCQSGIPDALRGEVWQLLAKTHEDEDKIELYKDLITKETDYEKIIVSDIYRTFPAHDYFKRKYKRSLQGTRNSSHTITPPSNPDCVIPSLTADDTTAVTEPEKCYNGHVLGDDHDVDVSFSSELSNSSTDLTNVVNTPGCLNVLIDPESKDVSIKKDLNHGDFEMPDESIEITKDSLPSIPDSLEIGDIIHDKTITDIISPTDLLEDALDYEITTQTSKPALNNEDSLGSSGQECLYRLIKAYSVYDTEIGYCQGLSFLSASLLLHMPEEQAFSLLVKIMYSYDLRNLFKQGFQELQLKFYILDRLIQDNLPALHSHFTQIGIEVHMFASQWFLTIFTAKFPLNIVFNILDVFLCKGMNTIFAVSLSLLKLSERELLHLDFEDVLKYFRVNLPKKFRSERIAHKMMEIAGLVKISNKKLKKYEKDYIEIREREQFEKDPLEILKKENSKLKEANMRLERENDALAQELVTSKIRLKNDLDATEDTAESLGLELEQVSKTLRETEDENKRLLQEIHQIKEMYRREVQRFEDKFTSLNDSKVTCED